LDKIINKLDFEDEEALRMINALSNKKLDDKNYQKALNESTKQEEIKYENTRKLNIRGLSLAAIGVAIIASFWCGYIRGSKSAEEKIYNTSVVIEITDETSKEIDNKIDDYMKKMGTDGPRDTRIAVKLPFDPNNPGDAYGEAFFDYFPGILLRDIIEASKCDNPIIEVRCALIAAVKIINKPYIEENFNKIFDNLKEDEEFRNSTTLNNLGFYFGDDVTNIWQMLGYDDMEDFYKNARSDTKEIMSIMNNNYDVRSNNGKRM